MQNDEKTIAGLTADQIIEIEEMDSVTSQTKKIRKPTSKASLALETTIQAAKEKQLQDISSFLYASDKENEVSYEIDPNTPDTCLIHIKGIGKHPEDATISIQGYNKAKLPAEMRKLWVFLFNKIYEQAYSATDKKLYKDEVTFTLSEIIQQGIYTSDMRARTAVKEAYTFMKQISIKGTYRCLVNGKWQDQEIDGNIVYNYSRKNGIIKIALNQKLNWLPLLEYYSSLPLLFWHLNKHAAALFELIFDTARINATSSNLSIISETAGGKHRDGIEIVIGLQRIYEKLMLPDTAETKKNRTATAQIKNPIYKAIEEIEEYAEQDTSGSIYFDMSDFKENLPIEEWLAQSKLRVKIYDDYAEPILNIVNNSKRKIKEEQKKIEKRANKKRHLENTNKS